MNERFFIQPSAGLWFGAGALNKDREKRGHGGGEGGLVLGDWLVQLGLLVGGIVGFGRRWGLYTGLMGAFALVPLLQFGFIGIPIGVHFNRRFGVGLIIPVFNTSALMGIAAGAILFYLALQLNKR